MKYKIELYKKASDSLTGLNVFIANFKQGVGPQVLPTLVTALPRQFSLRVVQIPTYQCDDIVRIFKSNLHMIQLSV